MPLAWSIIGVAALFTGGMYAYLAGLNPACITDQRTATDPKEYLLIAQVAVVAGLASLFFVWPKLRDKLSPAKSTMMAGLCFLVLLAGSWNVVNTCGCTAENPWFGDWLVEYAQDRYVFADMCRDIILTDETGAIIADQPN